jgi:ABC-type lipoprotein release transport system permease subunit
VWLAGLVGSRGAGRFTAAQLWARADLRGRWRSWVVLGLLAGISAGIAAAALAGARRTTDTITRYERAAAVPDAAVLPNDFEYDAEQRAKVAALPEVAAVAPFIVPYFLQVTDPPGMTGTVFPTDEPATLEVSIIMVDGRLPDPARVDEVVINEVVRDKYNLGIGDMLTVAQVVSDAVPPGLEVQPFEQSLRVVGIAHASSDVEEWQPSPAFYVEYKEELVGPINQFMTLKRGEADFDAFHAGVERTLGGPTNVVHGPEIFGTKKLHNIAHVERAGLLLFALTVLLGAGVLVGQALVRAVAAGAGDLPTWRAIGADRTTAVPAMVLPSVVSGAIAAVATVATALALSPRFPIGFTRRFELDPGVHADWMVLGLFALGVAIVVVGAAWLTAEIRVRRGDRSPTRPPLVAGAMSLDMPPAMLIGARLASEPGRGRRAVPVRSALLGAIVGVVGLVGCLTFRAGLADTVDDRARAGVVWDFEFAQTGEFTPETQKMVENDDAVDDILHAKWARAVTIDGKGTSVFGMESVRGDIALKIVEGRAPEGPDELAIAPATMQDLGIHVGDEVQVGPNERPMRVVGSALLPPSSHTQYDQSAWTTLDGLAALAPDGVDPYDFYEDRLLVRWKDGADVAAAQERLLPLVEWGDAAAIPEQVAGLRFVRTLPFFLALFFAVLGSATVAHALVTTVRRRKHDLAILRSIGFTRRNSRFAIAWQATLLTIAGLLVGVPLGIIVGRAAWKQVAEDFPVVYVPPLALLGVLLVVPVALLIANLLAAGPARAATRIRPAQVLRTE